MAWPCEHPNFFFKKRGSHCVCDTTSFARGICACVFFIIYGVVQ
eukprot:SAG31_NODE_597_length_13674_cov_3.402947_11_plen_44_part_00